MIIILKFFMSIGNHEIRSWHNNGFPEFTPTPLLRINEGLLSL